jgi:predicted RNA-binding Zn-ribbon protein involved in translation (DUF1610 family)
VTPHLIFATIKTAAYVTEFIVGGALAVALAEIGGAELEAATLCLRNMQESNDPQREVELAVGHLQSAHFTFRKAYKALNFFTANFSERQTKRTIAKVQQINIMMAMCYSYLSEPTLMTQSIDRSEEAFWWMTHTMGGGPQLLSAFNPRNYLEVIDAFRGRDESVMSPTELNQIRAQLSGLAPAFEGGSRMYQAQRAANDRQISDESIFSFTCSSCGTIHRVKWELAGKMYKCPHSGESVVAHSLLYPR